MFAPIPQCAHPMYSSYRLIHSIFLLLLTLSLLAGALAAQNDIDTAKLEVGKPIERELAGGQSHSYRIVLTSDQYLHVVAEQRGIDLVITLFGPDEKPVIEVDSPNGTQGPELVSAIAETSGSYRLEVHSLEKDAPAGRYEVKIEELRKATGQDKNRIAAERAFIQAKLLYAQGTAESLRSAIKKYEEALLLYRAIRDHSREATTLHNTGYLYNLLGEKQKALDYYGQALPLLRAVGDRSSEATTLNNIGAVYSSLGEKQKALDYYRQALLLYRAVGDRSGEARTLIDIGAVYDDLGEKQKALDYYGQALPLLRAVGDRGGEARALNGIGAVYDGLGEKQKALDYYAQALPITRVVRNRRGEATTLNNIGMVYNSLGENQKALDYYGQALLIIRAAGDRFGEARTLNNIGAVYDDLGEKQKALDYYGQALPLLRAVGNRYGEARTLNNVGLVYNSLGEKQKALDYYGQALALRRAVGDRSGEAATLHNIGVIFYSLGENQKALDYYAQSLSLLRAVGDRRSEATTLNNIGAVYSLLGEKQKALDHYREALPITRAVGDRSGEATALNNLKSVYESLNNPRFAIFYGKQSVNVYQQLRSNIQGLDKDVQKTYLKSVEQTYRGLAELLITQGRAAEAQQVLNAFKDQQLFDFDQTQSRQLKPLVRTSLEEEFALRYEKTSDSLGKTGGLVAELKRKLGPRQPNAEEARQVHQLEAQLKSGADEFSALLKQAEIEFSKSTNQKDQVGEVSDMTQMQAMLRQITQETGQKTAAVYTIVGETKFHALIITANGITSVSTPIKGDKLNNNAQQLWALLQSANYDPTTLSNELYNAVFKPIEDKLPKDTKTIIWSLDGNLRYLPMAALYDGKQYLVERYNHVVFTRADKERLTRAVSSTWTGYGFSASAPHRVEVDGKQIEFRPLDFVKDEMQIFRNKTYPEGIIDGDIFPEAQFTKASLLATLKQKRPLVHISSHFRFRPGDAYSSFLLLGDGQVMTLAEMKEQANLFQGVELLTLSACDTAAQRPDATGREVDAFAELAQRLGAGGVIASLWAVLDRSTARLMKGFYRNREDGKYSKAEALRKAQLDLLYGNTQSLATSTNQGNESIRRGSSADEDIVVEARYRMPFQQDKKKPFAHPYYWSPFVLFGNWK
ncbi:MAG: tetratricopeptide repeat protein [Pyrinomonadaceae bacterium]